MKAWPEIATAELEDSNGNAAWRSPRELWTLERLRRNMQLLILEKKQVGEDLGRTMTLALDLWCLLITPGVLCIGNGSWDQQGKQRLKAASQSLVEVKKLEETIEGTMKAEPMKEPWGIGCTAPSGTLSLFANNLLKVLSSLSSWPMEVHFPMFLL